MLVILCFTNASFNSENPELLNNSNSGCVDGSYKRMAQNETIISLGCINFNLQLVRPCCRHTRRAKWWAASCCRFWIRAGCGRYDILQWCVSIYIYTNRWCHLENSPSFDLPWFPSPLSSSFYLYARCFFIYLAYAYKLGYIWLCSF